MLQCMLHTWYNICYTPFIFNVLFLVVTNFVFDFFLFTMEYNTMEYNTKQYNTIHDQHDQKQY